MVGQHIIQIHDILKMATIDKEIIDHVVNTIIPSSEYSDINPEAESEQRIEKLKNTVKKDMYGKTEDEMFDTIFDVLTAKFSDFGPTANQTPEQFKYAVKEHISRKTEEELNSFFLEVSSLSTNMFNKSR